jgi:single-stranded DNA-specific DHH superfamily exonuclease
LNEPNYNVFHEIQKLKPFGQGFSKPLFYGEMIPKVVKTMGKKKNHVSMVLNDIKAVKFFVNDEEVDYIKSNAGRTGKTIKIVYSLSENDYQGKNLQLIIEEIIID